MIVLEYWFTRKARKKNRGINIADVLKDTEAGSIYQGPKKKEADMEEK